MSTNFLPSIFESSQTSLVHLANKFQFRSRNTLSMSTKTKIGLTVVLLVLCLGSHTTNANIEPIEDDFDVNNKKVDKFEDFDLNITPPPGSNNVISSTAQASPATGSTGFIHAFVASLSVIVVSELGDKTFFIAAIMAMRHARLTVFAGAMGALGFMTVLSALFGYATTVIPRIYTYYISTFLFAVFGLKMLYDGYKMSNDEGAEELEEVQATLRKREDDVENQNGPKNGESSATASPKLPSTARRILFYCFSRVFLQAFTMTFLAEWGDRSQLATIVLAAREDVSGVCVGGVLGHSLCTGLAVLGGRMVAQKISVRTVTIIGGIVFILFAITSLFFNPE